MRGKRRQPSNYFTSAFAVTFMALTCLFIPFFTGEKKISQAAKPDACQPVEESRAGTEPAFKLLISAKNGEELELVCLIKFDFAAKKISVASFPPSAAAVKTLVAAPADRFARMGMADFAGLIDYIGAVSYSVPYNMVYNEGEGGRYINIPEGRQKLGGERIRTIFEFPGFEGGELQRIHMQTDIIARGIEQRFDKDFAGQLESVFRYFVNLADTNLTYLDFMRLENSFAELCTEGAKVEAIFPEGIFDGGVFSFSEENLAIVRDVFS
ncbi:MAG: LCP family protein [Oscillospiraceae bacterium]|jgi:hypothetical protein|nr:LCP family protein [Oscillospiraceae bacterium]